MNSIRSIVKNSGASLIAQVSNPLSSFLLVFFIARFEGVNGVGHFSSALSLLYIFQALSSFGFSYLITREVSRDKSTAGKYLINASSLGLVLSIIMALIMCLVANVITKSVNVVYASYILSISLIPYTLETVCVSILKAHEKFEYITISQMSGNIFKIIAGLYILFKGYGINNLMFVILVSHLIIFVTSLLFTFKCTPKQVSNLRIDIKFCRWIFLTAPVFALIFILNTVRWNIDTLILTNMIGEREVGFYNAAYKLMNIFKLGLSCYIAAIQPVMFRLFRTSKEKFVLVCEESMRYLLIMLIPIAFGATLLSDKIIVLVFGLEFMPAAYALSIIIWILIFSADNLIFANALVASDYQNINLIGNAINMIANLCLNILLIPKLGFIGASAASLVSSIFMFIYQYYYISKYLFKVNYLDQAKKPIIASTFMGVGIIILKNLNIFVLIAIGIIIYFIGLLVLNTFTQKDVSLLKRLWKGEKDLGLLKQDM